MANKDLLKQAIAEAKSVREAAIANAKEALEETLTPHLKDMLAAKLQEMEDKDVDEVAVNEVEEEVEEAVEETVEEGSKEDEMEEAVEEAPVEEAEHDGEEAADDEGEEAPEEVEDEIEDEPAEDEDLKDLSVGDFKDMIRDIIAQEMGDGGAELDAELPADDMDAGADLDEPGEGDPLAGGEGDEEIDLDELIRELEAVSEGESEEEMEEGKKKEEMEEEVAEAAEGPAANEVPAESDSKEKNVNDTIKEENSSELEEALETIETLRKELNEVNLLNSKLLYVNKIFKANNLSESQKVNIIAAFDKAETVKEVKLVFETVSDNVVLKKETTIKEHKGSASKATGTTASKPEVISEVSSAVLRMQKLAGIIK